MPYCEKCGQKMSFDAVFCSKCGRRAYSDIVETKIEAPVSFTNTEVVPKPKPQIQKSTPVKNKRTIIVSAVAATLVIVGLVLFLILWGSYKNRVVTENADGETVFAFTFSEFVDRYNENVSDKILISDFYKSGNEYELYEDDYTISVSIDKGNNPCYVTNLVLWYYGDNDEVPDEAVALLRALYPRMSEKQAYEDLEHLMIHGSNDFKNVMLFYENNDDYQYWNYHPFD